MQNDITNGLLLIDKPTGMTSHDVVDAIRRKFNTKKVGHTGTLDPLATGLLVILIGKKATKLSDILRHDVKSYIITMELGYTSNELDTDGKITEKLPSDDPQLQVTKASIISTIQSFLGSYDQEVPHYSAVKVDGKKLYEYARAGIIDSIDVPSREVTIHDIDKIRIDRSNEHPSIQFEASVSSGTYTRALVRDIGVKLGLPTIQTGLRRTRVGNYSIEDAVSVTDATEHDIIPIEAVTASDE